MLLEKQAPLFLPQFVAEVAAGYFWDPARATGSGATFTVPEGNGKTAYDMIVPSAAVAPTTSTINGRTVVSHTNAADDSLTRTSAVKQRGWTGATMIFGWVSCASAPSIIFGHWRSVNNIEIQLTASDIRLGASDGTVREARFPLPPGGYAAGPFYIEAIATPNAAHQMWYNRVQQTPNVSASLGATLQDTASFLSFSGTQSDAGVNNILADFKVGLFGITNGVPSANNRDRLYRCAALA